MKKKVLASVFIIIASLYLLQKLLVPKYLEDMPEGRLIGEYYSEEMDHDLVFIGDCEVYENFSPYILWNEYGINSFIRGSGQQLIWQSYYLLEDTLRYEKPKAVIFNVLAMQYNEPQREEYNRMSLEGMKWSASKIKAIQASMMEKESFLDYVFPILRYHSRWSELKGTDFSHMFDDEKISHNGYYMRVDEKPADTVPVGKILPDYSFGENAYKYLNMINDLCLQNDIELILIKAPTLYPYWYEQWDEQIRDYAKEKGLKYINYLELIEETGIDFTKDTYDGGLHLNVSGAEKISRHLGSYLINNGVLESRKNDKKLSDIWQEKSKVYEMEKEKKYKETEGL